MTSLRPMTANFVIGSLVCIALLDGMIRFGLFPIPATICNLGIGLGIRLPETVLWGVIVLMLIVALWRSMIRPFGSENVAWGAVFTGGLINAFDRLLHDCVTDYLHLPFFPSFNLADIMIFLGIVTLTSFLLGILPKAHLYVS